MAINYTTYVAQLSNLMAASSTTPQFQTMLPGAIDYSEQRIYRELDLLKTVVTDYANSLTSGSRMFTLPTTYGYFIVVNGANVITPVGSATPEAGTRNRLVEVSRDYLDTVWNSNTNSGVPALFAMIGGTNGTIGPGQFIVGPWPNANYMVEVVGTIRPVPLSQSNPTTLLTSCVPDLFIAASMIFASGYMRNFGQQSDNPQMAQSWEAQYEKLIVSAAAEELRKKGSGPGWTPLSNIAPTPER